MAVLVMVEPEDPDAMRARWEAENDAAIAALVSDLLNAGTAEEIYAAHARFVRATAAEFSRQIQELSALLRRLM